MVWKNDIRLSYAAVWVGITGLLIPNISGGLLTDDPLAKIRANFSSSEVANERFMAARNVSVLFPAIGTAEIEATKLSEMLETRKILDTLLHPSETYLDLSNRHANYVYLQRVPPVSSSAVYNLVSEGQQTRAIAALTELPPPLVLVSNSNIVHDGGPVGLRSPLLFSWILEQSTTYKFMKNDSQVWMVSNTLVPTAQQRAGLSVLEGTELVRELGAIWTVADLRGIPDSYGGSWGSLLPKTSIAAKTANLGQEVYFAFETPLRINLSAAGESGEINKLRLLKFDLRCLPFPKSENSFSLSWADAEGNYSVDQEILFNSRGGTVVVPLYSSVRWQFFDNETMDFTLSAREGNSCDNYSVSNSELREISVPQ
jgi:hypothetical protein